MKNNLKQTLEIGEQSLDPRIKLEARRIANDCYRYIMDLVTNGVIVADALKYVQSKVDHLNGNGDGKGNENKTEADSKQTESETDTGKSEDKDQDQTTNTVF
jgi:hypothetical protein